MRRHHGDAQVEQAVAEADRALEPVQGLGADALQPVVGRAGRGRGGGGAVAGRVGGGGRRRGRRGPLLRRPPPAALLQLGDVRVALVVHLPGFTEDPASFDVRCRDREMCFLIVNSNISFLRCCRASKKWYVRVPEVRYEPTVSLLLSITGYAI